MRELDEDEVPICGLRPFPDGSTLKSIDGIWYCLYDRVSGRAPEDLNEESVERLGMMAARIHNAGARSDAPERLRLDADTYVRDNLPTLSLEGRLPGHLRDRYLRVANDVADLAERLLCGVETFRIHGDFHPGNVLLRDGRFFVLDFDDMVVGPAVQDLWMLIPGRDAHSIRLREVFLEAYGHFRAIDRATLDLIEPLRGLRRVHYAAWLARRWHDPLFPATWPQYGTDDWWAEELADLGDVLVHAAAGGMPTGMDAELQAAAADVPTNADLFWDWEEPTDGGDGRDR